MSEIFCKSVKLYFQLNTLMHCCCKRKNFLFGLNKMIGPVMLLSLRETTSAMEVGIGIPGKSKIYDFLNDDLNTVNSGCNDNTCSDIPLVARKLFQF